MHGVEIFVQTLDFPEYASKRLCARADAKRDEDQEKSNTVVEVMQEIFMRNMLLLLGHPVAGFFLAKEFFTASFQFPSILKGRLRSESWRIVSSQA